MTKENWLTANHVCEIFDISKMTLWRWLKDEELDFPKPIVIRTRRYWLETDIDAFLDRQIARSR